MLASIPLIQHEENDNWQTIKLRGIARYNATNACLAKIGEELSITRRDNYHQTGVQLENKIQQVQAHLNQLRSIADDFNKLP